MRDHKKELRETLNKKSYMMLPGVYDCLSAKLAEKAGFDAVYLSGGALSICGLGRPDIGFLNLSEMESALHKILAAVDIPVLSDADNGFGNAIHAGDTAALYDRMGVCGMQIDDQVLPQTVPTNAKECLDWKLTAPKIKAVRKNVSDDFIVIFRTIANSTKGLEDAVRRVNLAADLGADYAFVDGIKSERELEMVSEKARIKLLINMNEKGVCADVDLEKIKRMNYRIGLYPVSAMAVAAKAFDTLFHTLQQTGSTRDCRSQMYNPVDVYNMMGLNSLTEEYLGMYE